MAAHAELDAERATVLVLDILQSGLRQELHRRVGAHRESVLSVVETLWIKYRVTLRDIEGERDAAQQRLSGLIEELGYVG